jgi:hypothetical protein
VDPDPQHWWQCTGSRSFLLLVGNLVYCLLVPGEQASWDPRGQEEEGEGGEGQQWRHQYCDTRSLSSLGTEAPQPIRTSFSVFTSKQCCGSGARIFKRLLSPGIDSKE